jgi:hypothetical protein
LMSKGLVAKATRTPAPAISTDLWRDCICLHHKVSRVFC